EKGFEDDRFFRPARVTPKRWLRAGDVAMIVEMVRHSLGVTILSRWAVERRVAGGGLVMKQLGRHGLPTAWHAVIRAGGPPNAPAGETAVRLAQWWAKRGRRSLESRGMRRSPRRQTSACPPASQARIAQR